jgi:hypothetical protein
MYLNNHYVVTAQHHRFWFRRNLVSDCVVFLTLLLLSALTLFPAEAYSQVCNERGDIPFKVSNDALVDNKKLNYCILCTGPWLRTSKLCEVKMEAKLNEFYAANRTVFSPFGKWVCKVYLDEGDPQSECTIEPLQAPLNTVDFCLINNPFGSSVFIDVVTNASGNIKLKIDGNVKNTPCSSSVVSFLGDNPKQEKSKGDRDFFQFSGTAGEEVKVTLQPSPTTGNNDGEAILRLKGDSLRESVSGVLPLEIISALPADGQYSIVVKQANTPVDARFRGDYILSVEPLSGNIDLIEPAANVEK